MVIFELMLVKSLISGRLAFPLSFRRTLPILFGVRKVVMGNIFANVKEFYIFTFISIIKFDKKFIEVNSVKSINSWIYYKFNITDTPPISTCFKFKNDITWVTNGDFFYERWISLFHFSFQFCEKNYLPNSQEKSQLRKDLFDTSNDVSILHFWLIRYVHGRIDT